jgi:dihydroneopterin triphosphate diphosphatase
MNSKPYKIPESVLVVIHTIDLQVLLMERADKPGFWQSVTGSKDALDEPLVETCVREVFEETGVVIEQRLLPPRPSPADAGEGGRKQLDAVGHARGVPLVNLLDWQLENIYEIYPVWRHRYAPGVTHNTEHVFGLLVPRDVAITLAPREHLRYEWLPYREAADKCFSPSNAEAILLLPHFMAE